MDTLTDLYYTSDQQCTYVDENKIKKVVPTVKTFKLSANADQLFETIHDRFEMDVAKVYEHDSFISGKHNFLSSILFHFYTDNYPYYLFYFINNCKEQHDH